VVVDSHLLKIMVMAAAVTMLSTLNVAARPAAIATGRVALAFTVSEIFFMLNRFANLFYLPLLAVDVDLAAKTGDTGMLSTQLCWVLMSAAVGAGAAWALLPSFVELYRQGVYALEYRKSMVRVVVRMMHPSSVRKVVAAARRPSLLGTRLFKLGNVPADFLIANVIATAIWTAGPLCALLASAIAPQYKSTAVLLSGMVNAFAAIAFAVFVDPKAAVITDEAVAGERPKEDVDIAAVHLSAGNFLGACLGLLVLWPGTEWILWISKSVGSQGGNLVSDIWVLALANAIITILSSTSYASRVSAVVTKRVATALTVYNVFFLVTRLAQQIYSPVLGSVRDYVVDQHLPMEVLGHAFRTVIFGASLGSLIACLMLDTFVEIYNKAVVSLDRLNGSVPRLLGEMFQPRAWAAVFRCLRKPTTFGLTWADFKALPQGFLWGNLFVTSVYTIGVLSAIYAGAQLDSTLARTATLLSSVVNGLATITISLVVWPTLALMVDECVRGVRPMKHIYASAFYLMIGMLIGTVLSQLLFDFATQVIVVGAHVFQTVIHR
jgi:hypothetical protein